MQDRHGKTIWRADDRQCDGCSDVEWQQQPVPVIPDNREQVADPGSAYQLVTMMQGVVERGTGIEVKAVGKPLAGKTGTTNDFRDAWFEGFSPDLAAGVYVGYDQPDSLGKDETGGHVAAPIFRDFMIAALENTPAIDFRIPPGLRLYRVSAATGLPVSGSEPAIYEAYKPGTEPGKNPQRSAQAGAADEAAGAESAAKDTDTGDNQTMDAPANDATAGSSEPIGSGDAGRPATLDAPPAVDAPRPRSRGARPQLRPQTARRCRPAALPPAAPAAYISDQQPPKSLQRSEACAPRSRRRPATSESR